MVCFFFKHNGNYFHYIIARIIMPMTNSKEDTIQIKPVQLYRVSRYGKETMVEYFDYKKE